MFEIDTEIEASTGVFGRVICAIKRFIRCDSQTPSIILVFSTRQKNLSSQFFDLDIDNPLGRGILAKYEPSL